ncbi:putative glucan -beta-glucosidase protein [Paramyrothecium foliicola]|nr:putative glucan -beta-glucosidase protein [Paramyrothecium foliicola]
MDEGRAPRNSIGDADCNAASLIDRDNDKSIYGQPDFSSTQISIFSARGMLIESEGPSWFLGGGSEHSVLYNYLISGAKSVYIGHFQTESHYYQPKPRPPGPFRAAAPFPNDPDFSDCEVTAEVWDDRCNYAWGMQIIDSKDVMIHSAGLYSFFNEYYQDCIPTHNCQDRILKVKGSTGVVIFNRFTMATINIASGIDDTNIPQEESQRGFTTEVSVWVPLPGSDHVDVLWIDTGIWNTPTVSCPGKSCMIIIPTSPLGSSTTIQPSSYTTSPEFGGFSSTSIGGVATTIFATTTTTLTISVPSIVTDGIGYSNFNVTKTGAMPISIYPSIDIPPVVVGLPDGSGSQTSRTITLPPWPRIDGDPSVVYTDPATLPSDSSSGLPTSTMYFTPLTSRITVPAATVTTVTFPGSTGAITIKCPAETSIVFATPPVAVGTTCNDSADRTLSFSCPTTRALTFLGPATAVATVDCSLVPAWKTGGPPGGQIIPEDEEIGEPELDDDGVHMPCTAWFFFFCISWGNTRVRSWYWILPPGIYGPGPPPINLIRPPPGVTIRGNLPNWPRITIGEDHRLTSESEPECEKRTAEACTTTNYVSDGSTTSPTTLCETITGCSISVSDSTTDVIGDQAAAPIGTWGDERWDTQTLGLDYTRSGLGLWNENKWIVEYLLLLLGLAVIIARVAVCFKRGFRSFWLSGLLLILSFLFYVSLVTGDTCMLAAGRDFNTTSFSEGFAKWTFASALIFDFTFYLTRFSLLAFYNELFPLSETRLRIFMWIVVAYTATIIVGADGVNSKVRDLSRDIALSNGLPETQVMLGNAPRFETLKPGDIHESHNLNQSTQLFVVASACGFFSYQKMFKPNSERKWYSKEETEEYAKEMGGVHIAKDLTIGDIYARKNSAGLTNAGEGVTQHWSYKRVVLTGDAAHKFAPYFGLGFNSGIQDIVVLSNQLVELLRNSCDGVVGTPSLEKAFAKYQIERSEHIGTAADVSAGVVRAANWATPIHQLIDRYISPNVMSKAGDGRVLWHDEAVQYLKNRIEHGDLAQQQAPFDPGGITTRVEVGLVALDQTDRKTLPRFLEETPSKSGETKSRNEAVDSILSVISTKPHQTGLTYPAKVSIVYTERQVE